MSAGHSLIKVTQDVASACPQEAHRLVIVDLNNIVFINTASTVIATPPLITATAAPSQGRKSVSLACPLYSPLPTAT